MLQFDPEAVERNAHESTTEDLLDRLTAFRSGMEPEAIPIMERELERRGVDRVAIRQHAVENCDRVVLRPEGFAYRCSFCRRPAVLRRRGWHRLWGLLPVLPCVLNYCDAHAAMLQIEEDEDEEEV
jgi:hypothetical protein